ncbi:M55 family metallopeptidase [Aquamicrobium sp. LC103]|uniref:M55 family metallopeptidase n=1 Tax=Aquamicrobium sp. LC103 TaxID=1120658 RepID=UPI00063EC276|nr:M55 family metallopeptidase [Aquamicrobium sp. LC103]TKT74463.1 peptide ABC transporter [Aquamicrobium sp. LC103]
MKIFISADIEGTAGINHWDETIHGHADWTEYRALMTAEVLAACEGARAAGATEVVVKDAHDSGRNLLVERLPDYVRIVRNWSGHPDQMMFGVDDSFAAAIYTGYHSKAGTEDNPLAHTSNLKISRLLLNGEVASEFTINALCAALYGVPSVFLAGDAGICADARAMIPGMATVETLFGAGPASNSIAPARSCRLICEGVEAALANGAGGVPSTNGPWEVVVEFVNPVNAYQSRWYPGATAHGPRAVAFEASNFFEILRALRFIKG